MSETRDAWNKALEAAAALARNYGGYPASPQDRRGKLAAAILAMRIVEPADAPPKESYDYGSWKTLEDTQKKQVKIDRCCTYSYLDHEAGRLECTNPACMACGRRWPEDQPPK